MRRLFPLVLAMLTSLAAAVPSTARPATNEQQRSQSYVVLYRAGVSAEEARAAVRAAGGQIVRENGKVRVATARSSNPRFFAAASRKAEIEGVARDRRIGHVPRVARQGKSRRVDKFAFEKGDFSGEGAGAAVAPGVHDTQELFFALALEDVRRARYLGQSRGDEAANRGAASISTSNASTSRKRLKYSAAG